MAMSCVIRKASPTVAPFALRAISVSSAKIVTIPESRLHAGTPGSFRNLHQFSTSAVDGKLIKVLKSGIKSIESRLPVAPPADFPFKIEHVKRDIILKMDLPGDKMENIEVRVNLEKAIKEDAKNIAKPAPNEDDSDDDTSDNDSDDDSPSVDDDKSDDSDNDSDLSTDLSDDDEEEQNHATSDPPSQFSSFEFDVQITKKDGTLMRIQAVASGDDLLVKHMQILFPTSSPDGSFDWHSAPKFEDLAKDVQDSVKDYIRARGLTKTNVEFLRQHMVRKANPSDQVNANMMQVDFLKSFKKFVSK